MQERSFTIPCFRCGICCIRHQAKLSVKEARRIADRLKSPWHNFINNYTDQRWRDSGSYLLCQVDGACIFLRRENDGLATCSIHPFRPSACREWMAGLHRRECREGLERHWGLKVDSRGELSGPQNSIHEFQTFLNSLLK